MPPAAFPQATICRTRAGRIYAAPTTLLRFNIVIMAHAVGGINPSPTFLWSYFLLHQQSFQRHNGRRFGAEGAHTELQIRGHGADGGHGDAT